MQNKIFISYRRDDDPAFAARIADSLAGKFGKSALFMDIDNVLAGQRFERELAKALDACDVLIAIIGGKWTASLAAKESANQRDYVQEEIYAALQRGIVVIPVRVGLDGRLPALPTADDLRVEIGALLEHQKHDVTHEHFGRDVSALVEAIRVARRKKKTPTTRRRFAVAGAAAVVCMGVLALETRLLVKPRTHPLLAAPIVTGSISVVKSLDPLGPQGLQSEKRPPDETMRRVDPLAALAPGSGRHAQDCWVASGRRQCGPDLVVVPAGSFSMGSAQSEISALDAELGSGVYAIEGPQHVVTFAHPFAAGRFAVTFDDWDTCVADGGCGGYKPSDEGWGRGRRPVINVSWDDAISYTQWLSHRSGKTYRLPTEAEREYVTRAGTTTAFWWGQALSARDANFDGDGRFIGGFRRKTLAVDAFQPNAWGLYQVHGNVWEWTADCWHDGYAGAPTDGSAWTMACVDSARRVARGGSWNSIPRLLRAAFRGGNQVEHRDNGLGFRVVRAL